MFGLQETIIHVSQNKRPLPIHKIPGDEIDEANILGPRAKGTKPRGESILTPSGISQWGLGYTGANLELIT